MAHYGTVTGADAYHAARGNEAWASAMGEEKTAALVRASQYLDAVYPWPGQAADVGQALEWPRSGVTWRGMAVAETDTPLPVEHAAYEAALREVQEPGSLNPDFRAADAVRSYTEAVGPLTERREYAGVSSAAANRPSIPAIDGLLRGLLGTAGGSNFRVVRA